MRSRYIVIDHVRKTTTEESRCDRTDSIKNRRTAGRNEAVTRDADDITPSGNRPKVGAAAAGVTVGFAGDTGVAALNAVTSGARYYCCSLMSPCTATS